MLPVLLALLPLSAHAGVFEGKSMRGEWPDRASQREFTLPRGWWEAGLSGSTKASRGVRGTFGIVEPYDGAVFRHSRLTMSLKHGFSDRFTFYMHVPWVNTNVRNDRGAAIGTTALGDANTGFVFQPWVGIDDRAIAFQLDLKSPSGLEWPGNTTGGSAFTEGFLTGTGTTNLGAHVHGKVRPAKMLAVDANLGFTYKFAGVVGYVVQPDGFGNGWLKPGNEFSAGLSATLAPVDPLSFRLGGDLAMTGLYYYGVSGAGTARLETFWLGFEEPYEFAGGELQTVETDPAGVFLNTHARVGWHPSEQVELGLSADVQILAPDGRIFSYLGLEEFSPHPGTTLAVDGVVRW